MRWVIDRFEEDWAVLESLEMQLRKDIARTALPNGIREGDVLYEEGERWFVDQETTISRAKRLRSRFERLKNRPH